MSAIALSQFRKHFNETVDQAEREPVTITRADGRNLVLLSAEEYESMRETLYLMGSAENAGRLDDAISQLEQGKSMVRELIR